MIHDLEEGPEELVEAAMLQRGRKRIALLVLVVALVAAAYPVARWFLDQRRVANEDAAAEAPVYTVEEAIWGTVDLGAVHAELLPAWFIAHGRRDRDPASAERTRAQLDAALAGAPALADIVDNLAAARDEKDLADALIREDQLVLEWNATLRDAGQRFALSLPINGRQREGSLWAMSYFVLGDVELAAEGHTVPAQLLTRVDSLSVVESYMGHAGETSSNALIVVDRVATLAADRLWPLTNPALDHRLPTFHQSFAEPIRVELAEALAEQDYDVLRETGTARADLVWARDAINDRRSCGAAFRIRHVPMRGFSERELESWRGWATRAGSGICPDLTFGELEVMRESSWTLQHTAGVREAMHALTAHVAGSVALHEVRHVLDLDTFLECHGCPGYMTERAAIEASAYLASMAAGAAPVATLFQLCDLLEDGRGSGQYRRAARFIVDGLLGEEGCYGALPDDLIERAASMAGAHFGQSEIIRLPASFPDRLRSRWYP